MLTADIEIQGHIRIGSVIFLQEPFAWKQIKRP